MAQGSERNEDNPSSGICTRNIRLVVEYDGAPFSGWQVQPGQRTVQGVLSTALSTVLRRPIGALHVAGRTDAGVHARGQVLNFSLEIPSDQELHLSRVAHSVSELLRGEVSVLYADEVAPMFHARTSAVCKQYSYRMVVRDRPLVLDKAHAHLLRSSINIDRMIAEAPSLVGTHDLSSFRASDCRALDPVREILESELVFEAPYLVYRVVGRGFLKQTVRAVVGTLIKLGKGSETEAGAQTLKSIIAARDRRVAGVTAPPQGLVLDWVHYPEPFTLPAPFCWQAAPCFHAA